MILCHRQIISMILLSASVTYWLWRWIWYWRCRFNPSHCTVDFDIGQIIHTDVSVTIIWKLVWGSKAQIPLGSSCYVEPMHFGCVKPVEQHGSTCRDVTWQAKCNTLILCPLQLRLVSGWGLWNRRSVSRYEPSCLRNVLTYGNNIVFSQKSRHNYCLNIIGALTVLFHWCSVSTIAKCHKITKKNI